MSATSASTEQNQPRRAEAEAKSILDVIGDYFTFVEPNYRKPSAIVVVVIVVLVIYRSDVFPTIVFEI